MKAEISENSVQETLILPLLARAEFSRQHPELFFDPDAVRAAEALCRGLPRPDMSGYAGVLYAVRQDCLCEAARRYLALRPEATVVNLGCGLDSSFPRVDNGRCRWVNLDLPEVIALRRRLLPPREREECLGCDALDLSWLDRVDGGKGLFAVSGGLFYYFRPEEVRSLLCALAERFPGGGVCFDCESRPATRLSGRLVESTGNSGAPMHFSVGRPEALFRPWSANFGGIRTISRLPEKYRRRGALPAGLRLALGLGMRLGMFKFVEIEFRE